MNPTSPEPQHVYDWLDLPAFSEAERDAKEWLSKFVMPAMQKHEQGIDRWLSRYCLTVEWRGTRYVCSGASRLGDVWLKSPTSMSFYDHRVNVSELSNWRRILLPPTQK